MDFTLSISSNHLQIEPGNATPLELSVSNYSEKNEQYEIFIEGVDPEWAVLPTGLLEAKVQQSLTEKIFFRPSRNSESLAGTYPSTIIVRALSTGQTQKISFILEIKPFYYVSIDLIPKRGVITIFKKDQEFQVTLINLGNVEQSLQLFGADSDNSCIFDFSENQIHLTPGQQKIIPVKISSTSRSILSNTKLVSFSMVARSLQSSMSVGTTQGQLEIKAFASPASFIAGTIIFALAAGWIALIPKPPYIEYFAADKQEINLGDTIKLSWHASTGTKNVLLLNNEERVSNSISEKGEFVFTPKVPGKYTFQAFALRGDLKSQPQSVQLQVNIPDPIPLPEILDFQIIPSDLKLGQNFIIRYKFNSATIKATLSPLNISLDLKTNEIELSAKRAGDIQYILIAENASGITQQKVLKAKVTEPTLASIIVFRASPITNYSNRYLLEWQLNNAVRAEIYKDNEVIEVIPTSGTREIETTNNKVTLVVYDQEGRTIQKDIILSKDSSI